jgi:DNA-binding MarR family transcriptional regulator
MKRYTAMFTELVRAEIELWNSLDAVLVGSAGISLPQFQALAAIAAQSGSARVQEISVEMSITVGATSKLVDRLERDGLAARSAHPLDRRSSIVSLTTRGSAALASAEEVAETYLRGSLEGAPAPVDVAQLHDQLAAIRAHMRAGIAR